MSVLDYLNEHQEAILEDLKELVSHESPSFDKELVDICGGFIKGLISDKLNVEDITEFTNKKVGNHLKFELGEGEEKILLLTHYDTVWEKDALNLRIEDTLAYGPGILDMKGGIIQGIWALKAIKDLGLDLNKKIIFLLTSDEELLSPTSRELIESEATECEAVLVLEPPKAKTNSLKTARKGASTYKIYAGGISSHAGNDPNAEASAIHELAHQIIHMEALADLEKGTTINVGVIKGGTMSNIVSDKAEIKVDVRFFTAEEAERIDEAMKKINPILGKTSIRVEGGINRPPMEESEGSKELFELAKRSGEEVGIEVTGEGVGGVSDGNFTAAIGVPTLDGLGAVGEGPHARNEHISIPDLPKRTALLANLILKL